MVLLTLQIAKAAQPAPPQWAFVMFNGTSSYIEIPDSAAASIASTATLTV
jgi:hypothetical protein